MFSTLLLYFGDILWYRSSVEKGLSLLLQQLHHPLVHGPLHSIDNKGTHTAYTQATDKDAGALCPVRLFRNLN